MTEKIYSPVVFTKEDMEKLAQLRQRIGTAPTTGDLCLRVDALMTFLGGKLALSELNARPPLDDSDDD